MELFNLEVLESLTKEEQINIKIGIIETNPLETIPVVYLPEVTQRDYYFVSYSHLDYVEVYKDIFDLQLKGLSIWYDRGIPAGENWKDFAMKYMTPFDCKGVLFYLSENALISESIIEEIAFAKETNKPFITILISKNSESLSEMIERLHREGKIDNKKYDFYIKTFPKEIIYLDYNCPCSTKAEKILSNISRNSKLNLEKTSDGHQHPGIEDYGHINAIYVRGLNDYYSKQVVLQDYFDLLFDEQLESTITKSSEKKTNRDGAIRDYLISGVLSVGVSAFANMKNLESIEFPDSTVAIQNYAFYRCENLKTVSIKHLLPNSNLHSEWTLGDGTFFGCKSLKEMDFSHIAIMGKQCFGFCANLTKCDLSEYRDWTIEEFVFDNCTSLETVILPPELSVIERGAFKKTAIKELNCPNSLKTIGPIAFCDCSQLEKINLNEGIEEIGVYAFAGCESLKEIVLTSSLQIIGAEAFAHCTKLKTIIYKGTIEASKKLLKEEKLFNFFDECRTIKIVCLDGEYEIVWEYGVHNNSANDNLC